jgi:hypothetical protein
MKKYFLVILALLFSCVYLDSVSQPSVVTIGERFTITVAGTYDSYYDNAWLAMMLPIGVLVDSVVYLTTDTIAGVITQIDTLLCTNLDTIYSCDSHMCWQGFTTDYLSPESAGAYTATVYAVATDSTTPGVYLIDYLSGHGFEYYTVDDSMFNQPMTVNESAICEQNDANAYTSMSAWPTIFHDKVTIKINMSDEKISGSIGEILRPTKPGIGVYDIRGCLVKSVPITTNFYSPLAIISWDGRDEENRILPTGMYFIRFEINGYSETSKVLLIR